MKATQQKKATPKMDLSDSQKDQDQLQAEETILDLPEVKDIPGQEHVRPFLPGEMADTTISSADEEAEELLSEVNKDEDELLDEEANVSSEERELLRRSSESMSSDEDEDARKALVDGTDEDGTPLNEKIGRSGKDLDVPGSEDDDENEEIGAEDEENNSFSLPDQGDN